MEDRYEQRSIQVKLERTINMTRIWQIGSGVQGRRYDDLFLEHDVMLIGPGDYGTYDRQVYGQAAEDGPYTRIKLGGIRQFAEGLQQGDIVLLRFGREVISIGIVAAEEYAWMDTFDDVYGWDLQHTRRVIWQEKFEKELRRIQREKPLFGERIQIPTFTRVDDRRVLDPITHLFERCETRPLKDLPEPQPRVLSLAQVGQELFSDGLGHDAIHRMQDTLARVIQLVNWYGLQKHSPGRPTEHEIVAHVVVPVLMALGWSEQMLAVEWKKIDLAVFTAVPTDRTTCRLICEAKNFGNSLEAVLDQAIRYVDKNQLDACNKILLTDGGRFYLYKRDGKTWNNKPIGYLNIQKIRRQHLLPADTDAIRTIMALTPARIAEGNHGP